MNWRSVLLSDKSPLIVATALTVFGWYFTSISTYFSDQTIVYIVPTTENNLSHFLIKNISLNKSVERSIFQVKCRSGKDCLAKRMIFSEPRYGVLEQISPFAAIDNQVCFQDAQTFQVQISLAPGAAVRIAVYKQSNDSADIFLIGKAETSCTDPTSTQIRLEQYPSLIAMFLQNFILYYFLSIVVLILVFILTLWKLGSSAAQEPEDDNAARALTINLTVHRSQSDGGES